MKGMQMQGYQNKKKAQEQDWDGTLATKLNTNYMPIQVGLGDDRWTIIKWVWSVVLPVYTRAVNT